MEGRFKPIFPKEHGLWVWIFLPILVGGLCESGSFAALWILLATVFFGFMALTPARILYKNKKRGLVTPDNIVYWGAAYSAMAFGFGVILVVKVPMFLALLPIMAGGFYAGVRAFHGGYHQEVKFEFGGIGVFSLGALAAAFAVSGRLAMADVGVWLLVLLFVIDRTVESRRVVRLGGFRLALAGQQPRIAEMMRPVFLNNLFVSFMALMFALAILEKTHLKYSLFWAFFPGFLTTAYFYFRPPTTLKRLGYSELFLALLFGASLILIYRFY